VGFLRVFDEQLLVSIKKKTYHVMLGFDRLSGEGARPFLMKG
jgi:hypothetical protein